MSVQHYRPVEPSQHSYEKKMSMMYDTKTAGARFVAAVSWHGGDF